MAKQGQPSRKMMVINLVACSRLSDVEKTWTVNIYNTPITIRYVWLQGEITQSMDGCDTFTLVDSTGSVRVVGCQKVPSGCTHLNNGRYVMVIGELKISTPVPVVRAFKIQDLNDEHCLKELWPLEVRDQQQILAAVS